MCHRSQTFLIRASNVPVHTYVRTCTYKLWRWNSKTLLLLWIVDSGCLPVWVYGYHNIISTRMHVAVDLVLQYLLVITSTYQKQR
jgi:hypothetical protein